MLQCFSIQTMLDSTKLDGLHYIPKPHQDSDHKGLRKPFSADSHTTRTPLDNRNVNIDAQICPRVVHKQMADKSDKTCTKAHKQLRGPLMEGQVG